MFPSAVDIISAIEFDKSGDHLATGDRGGRVVLFERTDTKDVRCFSSLRVPFLKLNILSLLDYNNNKLSVFVVMCSKVAPEGIWREWITPLLGILSSVIKQSFRAMNLRYSFLRARL